MELHFTLDETLLQALLGAAYLAEDTGEGGPFHLRMDRVETFRADIVALDKDRYHPILQYEDGTYRTREEWRHDAAITLAEWTKGPDRV